MKQISCVCLIFLSVFLLFAQYSRSSARLLPSYSGEQMVKANGVGYSSSSIKAEEDGLFSLMGLEECNEEDEGCLRRRVAAEAHLDYIYTQHHKP